MRRGKGKRADYILYYKPNIPIAIIEAKDNTHSVGDGMQQGLEYADPQTQSRATGDPGGRQRCRRSRDRGRSTLNQVSYSLSLDGICRVVPAEPPFD
jgi:hypothetical protein